MTGTRNPQSPDGDLEGRMMRLEEHAGFAERTVEQLSEELRVLNERLLQLSRRLDAVDGRLGGVVERIEKSGDEKKPPT